MVTVTVQKDVFGVAENRLPKGFRYSSDIEPRICSVPFSKRYRPVV
ncbi:hypothetical protein GGI59_004312 [Rhizobium lentis]|uniref:Uncharacterized protein n=1 Tax=Rhizobium lentis TaxID=1138194 RepID=A0A7W8XGV0_9HYPH|nr:hypothetical protein [Rhizobium lentis]MBB5552085.1 hypothetical protein [Rhizobium lentis]MBB5562623.1 hypothetical protein [Rhizobium lentis]MBB5569830.1 hypothetical protein [Rhizobium lentis]